jgi:hypothetical protein
VKLSNRDDKETSLTQDSARVLWRLSFDFPKDIFILLGTRFVGIDVHIIALLIVRAGLARRRPLLPFGRRLILGLRALLDWLRVESSPYLLK